MNIIKYFIFSIILLQLLLLSGCGDNTSSSEVIDNDSFESYVTACENDVPESCYKAGKVYSSEAYKEADYDQEEAATKTAQFYLKSCELDFAKGCTEYGMMFSADTQRDESKDAKYYFKKACDGGDTAGCNLLEMAP